MINNIDELEFITSSDVLLIRNLKILDEVKIKNQLIVLVDTKLDAKNEDFLVFEVSLSDNLQSEFNYKIKDKVEMVKKLDELDINNLVIFYQENEKLFNNYNLISDLIKKDVDLKLIKMKMVELWKY